MKVLLKQHRPAIIIAIVAGLMHLVLPLAAWLIARDPAVFHTADTASYWYPAVSLLNHGSFTSTAGTPELIRTPGYPVILLPGILAGNLELVTLLLQAVMGAGSVFLVYLIASRLFPGGKAPLIAALLYAAEPLSLLYGAKLMTETPFVLLILLSTWIVSRFPDCPSLRTAGVAAIAMAGSVYLRPVAQHLPFVQALALFFTHPPRTPLLRRLAGPVFFLAIVIALLAPWQIRNRAVAGYDRFSAITDRNLYFHYLPAITSAAERRPYDEIANRLGTGSMADYLRLHPWQRSWPEAEQFRFMRNAGTAAIINHPSEFARLQCEGMIWTLVGPGATEYVRLFGSTAGEIPTRTGLLAPARRVAAARITKPSYFALSLGLSVIAILYYALCFAGLSRRIYRSAPVLMPFIAVTTLYLILAAGGIVGQSRLRHPVMPFVCIFAGQGAVLAMHHLRKIGAGNILIHGRPTTGTTK